ncbi:MAG: hypothetical protein COA78_29390 [Blastopirellula sp.]|nr:MAG: hypothetical protein COA78_29390 [Blastopirellula sp.]
MSPAVVPAVQQTRLASSHVARNQEKAAAAPTEKPTSKQPVDSVSFSEEALKAAMGDLEPEEIKQVTELKQRDQEVRSHEQAHLAAAGPYAKGGPSFTYQEGPDGQRYAVGGEVQIDTSPVQGDPEATIRKAQVIKAAAQAPATPSSQDQKVAASASQLEAAAQREIQERDQAEATSETDNTAKATPFSVTNEKSKPLTAQSPSSESPSPATDSPTPTSESANTKNVAAQFASPEAVKAYQPPAARTSNISFVV